MANKEQQSEKLIFVVAVHKKIGMPRILGFIPESELKNKKASLKTYSLFEVPVKQL